MTFTMLISVLSLLTLMRVLIMNGFCILCLHFICICWKWSCDFVSLPLLIWCVILINLWILTTLYPWDEFCLIINYVIPFCIIDLICNILLRTFTFTFMFTRDNCPIIPFLIPVSLSGFDITVMLASQNKFESIPSSLSFWNQVWEV